jgi:hypothetical protein
MLVDTVTSRLGITLCLTCSEKMFLSGFTNRQQFTHISGSYFLNWTGQRFGLQSGNGAFCEHKLTNKSALRIFKSVQEHPTFSLPETYRVRYICTFGWSTNNIIRVILRSKTAGKNFSYILERVFWNSEKKNTQWRWSVKTEERLALTLRLVYIPHNLRFPSSSEQPHARRQQHSC